MHLSAGPEPNLWLPTGFQEYDKTQRATCMPPCTLQIADCSVRAEFSAPILFASSSHLTSIARTGSAATYARSRTHCCIVHIRGTSIFSRVEARAGSGNVVQLLVACYFSFGGYVSLETKLRYSVVGQSTLLIRKRSQSNFPGQSRSTTPLITPNLPRSGDSNDLIGLASKFNYFNF